MTLVELYKEKNDRVNEAIKERQALIKIVRSVTQVDKATASLWLNGKMVPKPERRAKIAKALGANVSELFPYANLKN